MDIQSVAQHSTNISAAFKELGNELINLENSLKVLAQNANTGQVDPFIICLIVFILACFIGYYVVWKVTPALHSPLMAVTNAISSVIIVGGLIAAGAAVTGASSTFGLLAVFLATVNIFGGFSVTKRMLSMFAKKK